MAFKLLLLKLAALFSFCGGPLLTLEITKPHQHSWVAFLLAFLPVGLMAWGALSLESGDVAPSERRNVALGAVGSIAAMSLHLFAAWYIWVHPRTPDHGLYLFGILVGSVSAVLYLHFARRCVRSYRRHMEQRVHLGEPIAPH